MTSPAHLDCQHRPECDGCPSFELSSRDALAKKLARIERASGAYPHDWQIADFVEPPETLGYRNRARMVVTDEGSPEKLLGYYKSGSRDVIPIQRCLVHAPALEHILSALRVLLVADDTLRAFADFVDLRCDREGGTAILTLCGDPRGRHDDVKAAARDLDERLSAEVDVTLGVHLNFTRGRSAAILSGVQIPVEGPRRLDIEVGGRIFDVDPRAFFQVNPSVLEQIHERMCPELETFDLLVDLYCGVGVHALSCASEETRVVGFDVSEPAIECARRNAERLGVEAEFDVVSDEHALDWLVEKTGEASFGAVTNPGRSGMAVELVEALRRTTPDVIAYVSCEPVTLFRDLDRLADLGWQVRSIRPFDMMPRTEHVEVLAVLELDEIRQPDSERDFWPREGRIYAGGVSGPKVGSSATRESATRESTWVALVSGKAPHGEPPHVGDAHPMMVRRLRNVDGNSVVRIVTEGGDDREIRERLRNWGHPVVGDPEFGDRGVNRIFAQEHYLDRIALHCVDAKSGDERWEAPVPGQLIPLLRLPRKVLQGQER